MVTASDTRTQSPVAFTAGRALRPVKVASLQTYVPPRVLTNADLEKMVDTSDEWILQRTGIRERHLVAPGVATSDLAKEAAEKAMQQAGVTAADIDVIIVATTTADTIFPSTACLLQDKIGAKRAWGFDLGAACSGFTYALTTAAQFVATGAHNHVLVVGADVMSSIIDYTDRTTCVLFGDGAGAAVVSAVTENDLAGRGHPRFRARDRWQRRPRAVHAGGRQQAAGVARDGRQAPALRPSGRRACLPLRGAQDRGKSAGASSRRTTSSRATSICSSRIRPTGASSPRRPKSCSSTRRAW